MYVYTVVHVNYLYMYMYHSVVLVWPDHHDTRCCPDGWCNTCGCRNGWSYASNKRAFAVSQPGEFKSPNVIYVSGMSGGCFWWWVRWRDWPLMLWSRICAEQSRHLSEEAADCIAITMFYMYITCMYMYIFITWILCSTDWNTEHCGVHQ